MKKLLLIALLVVGCADKDEFCSDDKACNYTIDGAFGVNNIENNNICIYPEEGYCDCDGNVLDDCGVCNGDNSKVELWDKYYDVATTDSLDLRLHIATPLSEKKIPPEIGCLTNLTFLRISFNSLTGVIPSEIWEMTNLTHLSLQYNYLTGVIPSTIGNLTNLTSLALAGNQLTGGIPPEIGNLTNLDLLMLHHNQLTGEIPQQVCDLVLSNNLSGYYITEGNNLTNSCYDE